MRKRGLLKHRLTAICICAAMLCTTLFVGEMEAQAKSSDKDFQVKIEAKGKVKAGKKATFKVTITNTTKKSKKLTRLQTAFDTVEGIGIDGGLDVHSQFGEVRDSRGRKLSRNKQTGKLKKSIRFAAKEKKVYTLSGTIRKEWDDLYLPVIAVAVNGYNDSEYVGYGKTEDIKISSVKPAKKKVTVKWNDAYAGKYQVQYSLKKNFKGAKTVTVSGKKTSVTLKNLKSKKTYYIRVRECTTDKSVYYSWSPVKKVKIK